MTSRRGRSPKPKPPTISPEARAKLLKLVADGYDPPSALAIVGLSEAAVRADRALMTEVATTFRITTAQLRNRLLVQALQSPNVSTPSVIERQIELREAAAQKFLPEDVRTDDGGAYLAAINAKMDQLSATELQLVEWLMSPDELGERPPRLMTQHDWWYEHRKAEMARERAAAEAQPKPAPLETLRVMDGATPLPKSQSLVTQNWAVR
jgi:hypothetical protein